MGPSLTVPPAVMGRCCSSNLPPCAAPVAMPCCGGESCDGFAPPCCCGCGVGAAGGDCALHAAAKTKAQIKTPECRPRARNNESPPRFAVYRRECGRMYARAWQHAKTLVRRILSVFLKW